MSKKRKPKVWEEIKILFLSHGYQFTDIIKIKGIHIDAKIPKNEYIEKIKLIV